VTVASARQGRGRADRGWRTAGFAVLACAPLACGGPSERLERDVAAMREELASQRRSQEQVQGRLDRLEVRLQTAEAAARRAPAAVLAKSLEKPVDPLSGLPVFRLEPPSNPAALAPPLDTRVALRDPSEEDLDRLDRAPVNLDAMPEKTDPLVDTAFAASVRRYNEGDRKTARDELLAFAAAHPRHDAADNALYLAGMVFVSESHCAEGATYFSQVVREYPDSDAVGPSLLALGQCELGQGRREKARSYFERVLVESPVSAEATQAEAALQELAAKKSVAGRP
jgi:TolA-binding protein